MTAARCLALTICTFGITPTLAAAPVSPGAPFHIRHGESVELAHGAKLKFIGVTEGRCSIGGTCVWQGEADVEFELQVKGQTARASISIEDSSDLCRMIGKLRGTAHAVSEGDSGWGFFFLIDDPQMRTQANEPLYLLVVVSQAANGAFDQVHGSDFAILPCEVTLLDEPAQGGCHPPTR